MVFTFSYLFKQITNKFDPKNNYPGTFEYV